MYMRRSSQDPILIIIAINLFVFVMVTIRPQLVDYLGLTPALVWRQPWQIITHMFTHQAFFHIFSNMFTLYFFGQAVLQLLGDKRFYLIYLLGGVIGALFFVALAPLLGQEHATAIGASGAVFALGGVLAVLRPSLRVYVFPIPAPIPLWIAVLGGFMLMSFVANVAWQAHLGGLLFGAAAGYYYKRHGY
jgi:uncharacterized protein